MRVVLVSTPDHGQANMKTCLDADHEDVSQETARSGPRICQSLVRHPHPPMQQS